MCIVDVRCYFIFEIIIRELDMLHRTVSAVRIIIKLMH